VRIEFRGNAQYTTDSLKVLMRQKEGRRLDPVALDADTVMLYRYFQDVRLTRSDAPGGVVLSFTVSENPLVTDLVLHGLEEMKEEEVQALMRTKEGYPLYERDLDVDRETIADAYRRKGYHFADVSTSQPTVLAGGGRRVVFTVVEGPKVEVDQVIFRGNSAIGRARLLEVMETREGWFLFPKEFVEETLREDLVAVRRLYRAEGYLDAEVVEEDRRFTDDKSEVVVTIAIVEGPRYTVGSVRFDVTRVTEGPGAMPPQDAAYFTPATLADLLGLRPGDPYSGKAEDKGRERVREAYFRASYVDAEVHAADLRPRAEGTVVDLHVGVVEGRKIRVARIDVVGNEYTRDKIVRREVRQQPGQYVDRNELDRALTRIRGLRFFERVTRRIDDVPGPDGKPVPDLKTVTYEVVEAKTGKLSVGVALSTNGGLGASISFQKRNFDIGRPPTSIDDFFSGRAFTGAGQGFSAIVSPGTVTNTFAVSFTEPHLFGSDLGFSASLSKLLNFREAYREDFTGYSLTLSHPLFRRPDDTLTFDTALQWRHELVDVTDVRAVAVPGVFLFQGENEVRALAASLSLHLVDDAVRPNFRSNTALRFEYAGGVLGGDVDYAKASLVHDDRWTVSQDEEGRRRFLSFTSLLGLAWPLEDTPEVPPFYRFYAGGRGTLRGFAYRGAGPQVDGRPTGGEWLLVGSVEYEHPIAGDILSGVVFLDQGTLGTTLWEEDAWRWRVSAGFGVRVKLPFLSETPLALDFGFPLVKFAGDETSVVSFSLARDF
jgi:outer membrane protein assembly complex protein YaeT